MKTRNKTLDMVKAICAYSVVLLHIHFPGTAGNIANVLARFAVPVFFMVSGYFCYRGDDTEFIRTGKKIRHVLTLILVAFPVCAMWELIQNHIDGDSQSKWLESLFSGEHIRQFLLYNNSSQVKWHLWFLPALLYCYFLFAAVSRFRLYRPAYILIPVLLVIHFGMEEFSPYLGEHFRVMQFRNYLFTGFPFFMTGHLIHKYQQQVRNWFDGRKETLLYGMVAAGAVSSLIEYQYLGKQELLLGSVLMAVGLFLTAIVKQDGKVPEILAETGQKYAFFIYLFHLCVADILKDIFRAAGLGRNIVYLWMKPVMVCILVTAAAMLYFVVYSYLNTQISKRLRL
ncbi:acyltransferase [Blautia schinkii]|uniref:acyltransferase n=1 Tax=Blautia schinkii TaxID=180164 RepID=UPI00156ED79B|nr:acyltransferase [Blautia schinkii]NSK34286.1 acyltransferase [Blautia schinkii]NSK64930.1 acyltransferase [Blautia schinkii]